MLLFVTVAKKQAKDIAISFLRRQKECLKATKRDQRQVNDIILYGQNQAPVLDIVYYPENRFSY